MNQAAIIKPLAKGQITIPIEFRKVLNFNKNTILKAKIQGKGIYLEPIADNWQDFYVRDYSDEDIKEFIACDKIDRKTLNKIRRYLK